MMMEVGRQDAHTASNALVLSYFKATRRILFGMILLSEEIFILTLGNFKGQEWHAPWKHKKVKNQNLIGATLPPILCLFSRYIHTTVFALDSLLM